MSTASNILNALFISSLWFIILLPKIKRRSSLFILPCALFVVNILLFSQLSMGSEVIEVLLLFYRLSYLLLMTMSFFVFDT